MISTKPLKVIHVDDDPSVIRHMKHLLDKIDDVIYVRSFVSAPEALDFLKNEPVDLALLDVEMPDYNGLWLAEQIKDTTIDVAFITGHTSYAMKAFEVCAVDYLLKPLDEDRLSILLDRVRHRRQTLTNGKAEQLAELQRYLAPSQLPTQIFINMVGQIKVVKLVDIIYFNSNSNYTSVLMTDGERYTSSKSIKTYDDALKYHPDFKRVSRSAMINKAQVKNILRNHKTRQITLTMANGDVIETSYKTKEEAMDKLT